MVRGLHWRVVVTGLMACPACADEVEVVACEEASVEECSSLDSRCRVVGEQCRELCSFVDGEERCSGDRECVATDVPSEGALLRVDICR